MNATASLSPRLDMNDGTSIPQLGFGVYKASDADAEHAVRHALDVGYRHIDTASLYENEEGVGRALRSTSVPREDIFVTTKVWNDDQGYDRSLAAFHESRARLGLDYVDLYLIHWPMPMNGLFIDTWKALIDLKDRGQVRSIGVSNFPTARIDEIVDATGVSPVINQVELNPFFSQAAIRSDMRERGILTEAWAPLARGGDLLSSPVITEIAERHNATPAQVVLAWHLAHGTVAIPKSVTPSRIEENFGALGVTLTDSDIHSVDALDKGEEGRTGFDPETMTRR